MNRYINVSKNYIYIYHYHRIYFTIRSSSIKITFSSIDIIIHFFKNKETKWIKSWFHHHHIIGMIFSKIFFKWKNWKSFNWCPLKGTKEEYIFASIFFHSILFRIVFWSKFKNSMKISKINIINYNISLKLSRRFKKNTFQEVYFFFQALRIIL